MKQPHSIIGKYLVITAVLIVFILPQVSATPAMAEGGTHTVAWGETLWGIALRYGISLSELAAANGMSNPSMLYAGQTLVIPVASPQETSTPEPTQAVTAAPATTAIPEATNTPAPAGTPTTYIVQRGDNLAMIAARFGVPLAGLIAANNIANANIIHSGISLIIPAAPARPAVSQEPPSPTVLEGKQIIVVLSQQKVYAFENGALVQQFIVSTGLPYFPTVQGEFTVYNKIPLQRMYGPGYDLPNVQWVLYFYRDYSLHGAYWHNNFGQPMSHGCVNMRNEDAQWLYDWAPLGTPVLVVE